MLLLASSDLRVFNMQYPRPSLPFDCCLSSCSANGDATLFASAASSWRVEERYLPYSLKCAASNGSSVSMSLSRVSPFYFPWNVVFWPTRVSDTLHATEKNGVRIPSSDQPAHRPIDSFPSSGRTCKCWVVKHVI